MLKKYLSVKLCMSLSLQTWENIAKHHCLGNFCEGNIKVCTYLATFKFELTSELIKRCWKEQQMKRKNPLETQAKRWNHLQEKQEFFCSLLIPASSAAIVNAQMTEKQHLQAKKGNNTWTNGFYPSQLAIFKYKDNRGVWYSGNTVLLSPSWRKAIRRWASVNNWKWKVDTEWFQLKR